MKRVVIMLMSAGLLATWAIAPVVADEHGDQSGYEKKTRELSKDFESKIERLREEAKGLSGEARAEAEARIDRAQEKWDRAVKELNRMKAEQESADAPGTWEKMKSTAASAYDQTQQAYNEAAVYLGLKSSQTDPEAKAELEKRIENYMEDLRTRLQAARHLLERLWQRQYGLEPRDGGQGQQRQVDAIDAAGPHQGDGHRQHCQGRQVHQQAGQGQVQPADARQAPLQASQLAAQGLHPGQVLDLAAKGQQVGHTLDAVHQVRVQLAPHPHQARPAVAHEQVHHKGQTRAGQEQEREHGQGQPWVKAAQQQAHQGRRKQGHQGRRQGAQIKVLERLDVGLDTREQ